MAVLLTSDLLTPRRRPISTQPRLVIRSPHAVDATHDVQQLGVVATAGHAL